QACCVLRNDWRRHDQEMEAQTSRNRGTRTRNRINGLGNTTRGGRVHVQTVGLNAETKMDRHRAAGEIFLLTFLFIGLRRLGRFPGTTPHHTSVPGSRFSPTRFASSSARLASSRREAGTRISKYRPCRAKYRSVK